MKFKSLLIVAFFATSFIDAKAQGEPSAAPQIKTFATEQDIKGGAINSVNLFTGDVVLPMNIISYSDWASIFIMQ